MSVQLRYVPSKKRKLAVITAYFYMKSAGLLFGSITLPSYQKRKLKKYSSTETIHQNGDTGFTLVLSFSRILDSYIYDILVFLLLALALYGYTNNYMT